MIVRKIILWKDEKMEKIKDIVFDKIVDQILDLACGKTKTEIENLMS